MISQKYFDNSCGSSNSCGNTPTPPPSGGSSSPAVVIPIELHACMGLNACKGHDRFGTNECAGMGYCSTTTHVCHTLNNCRGQGGCGLYGSGEEQDKPGANDCAWKGSCATPIQAGRFSTQGENIGKSVWLLARKLFEERLTTEGREFGTPPFNAGPPTWWLRTLGPYDACGSSGDMNCTFGLSKGICGSMLTGKEQQETNICSQKRLETNSGLLTHKGEANICGHSKEHGGNLCHTPAEKKKPATAKAAKKPATKSAAKTTTRKKK